MLNRAKRLVRQIAKPVFPVEQTVDTPILENEVPGSEQVVCFTSQDNDVAVSGASTAWYGEVLGAVLRLPFKTTPSSQLPYGQETEEQGCLESYGAHMPWCLYICPQASTAQQSQEGLPTEPGEALSAEP